MVNLFIKEQNCLLFSHGTSRYKTELLYGSLKQ